MRSKPVLDCLRRIKRQTERNIKGEEERDAHKEAEIEREIETRVFRKAGGECRHWGGIKIQREKKFLKQ